MEENKMTEAIRKAVSARPARPGELLRCLTTPPPEDVLRARAERDRTNAELKAVEAELAKLKG